MTMPLGTLTGRPSLGGLRESIDMLVLYEILLFRGGGPEQADGAGSRVNGD